MKLSFSHRGLNRAPFFVLLFLTACSGAQVSVQPVNRSPEDWAQKSFDELAQSSTPETQTHAFTRLKDRATGYGFSWTRFWELCQNSPESLQSRLGAADFKALLALHRIDCRDEAFRSFAAFVIQKNLDLSQLLEPERGCTGTLGASLTAALLRRLNANVEADKVKNDMPQQLKDSQVVAQTFVREYSLNPGLDWNDSFTALDAKQWAEIMKALSQLQDRSTLERLLEIEKSFSSNPLPAQAFAESMLLDPGLLDFSVNSAGMLAVLSAFEILPQWQFEQAGSSQLQKVLTSLTSHFEVAKVPGPVFEKWGLAWRELSALRHFGDRIDKIVPSAMLLANLESWQRSFETDLRKDPLSAALFLSNREKGSNDALWLSLRTLGRGHPLTKTLKESFDPTRSPGSTVTEKILQARMSAHFAADASSRHKAISNFCALLSSLNLPTDTLDARQLGQQDLHAGCHILSHTDHKVELGPYRMPYDSVFLTEGDDLNIKAESFDGSLVDSSVTRVPGDLSAESHATKLDAITFPVVFALNVPDQNGFLPGLYYFVAHLPLRDSTAGPKAQQHPMNGFRGGKVKIEVDTPVDSQRPVVASLGSAGQKAPPPVSGGLASTSSISAHLTDHWLHSVQDPQGRDIFFDPRPTLKKLKQAGDIAQKNHNSVALIIDPAYLKEALDPTQRHKFFVYCELEDNASAAQISTCIANRLGPFLADFFRDRVSVMSGVDVEAPPLAFDATKEFTLPGANPGPENPNGAAGSEGEVDLLGFGDNS